MKILLINPKVREWAQPNVFPLGLGYIAAVLKDKGFEVNVIDMNVERDINIYHKIQILRPSFIGITGIITQYDYVKKIALFSRLAIPDSIIVCGGPLASSIPNLLLEKTEIDLCIRGEGENSILSLIKAISEDGIMAYDEVPLGVSSKSLTNRIFHMRDVEPIKYLDTISFPAYDLFPIETYINNPIAAQNTRKWIDGKADNIERSMNIIGSRGCPFSCLFCYHCYMGEGYRRRGHFDIISEMKFLQDTYGIEYIHFTDDAFCTSKKYMMKFCRRLKLTGTNIKWSCAGRANVVDEELISTMASAGCIGLCYGLESGSQKMLDRMNKKITIEQYEKVIRLNQKYFDYQDYTFIVGTPGETKETVQESIDFCNRMKITPSAVFYMTPYPGTPLFNGLIDCYSELFNPAFFTEIYNISEKFEEWISSLDEQGRQIAWNCTMDDHGCYKGLSNEELIEFHDKFVEETK